MTETLFEFCSEEWVALAHDFLVNAAKDVDLEGITFSMQETFNDAPAHLAGDSEGRVGWYFRIWDGQVEAKRGFLSEPDVYVEGVYEAFLPIARLIAADNPEGAAEATKALEKMQKDGSYVSKGEAQDIEWASELHDFLARRTL